MIVFRHLDYIYSNICYTFWNQIHRWGCNGVMWLVLWLTNCTQYRCIKNTATPNRYCTLHEELYHIILHYLCSFLLISLSFHSHCFTMNISCKVGVPKWLINWQLYLFIGSNLACSKTVEIWMDGKPAPLRCSVCSFYSSVSLRHHTELFVISFGLKTIFHFGRKCLLCRKKDCQ